MMSPDPPREERQEESEERVTDEPVTIQAAWVDMEDSDELMFVPDGPHEMDMGGSESEYSTDSDDNNDEGSSGFRENIEEEPQDQNQNPQEEGQARGYYQLLIPFPTSGQAGFSDDHSESQDFQSAENQHSSLGDVAEIPPIEEQSELTKTENAEITKREIDLTEDKVETIKSVMKGFVLPQASIPGWAAEVDEDIWKKQLFESFDTTAKSNSENSNNKPN